MAAKAKEEFQASMQKERESRTEAGDSAQENILVQCNKGGRKETWPIGKCAV